MGQFSVWIQHLYACEVLSIQGQVHAGPGPVSVYAVDPWLAHTSRYLLNASGYVMLMNASVQPIYVSVAAGQGPGAQRYSLLEEGVLQLHGLTHTAHSGLLLIRRQPMNINVGAITMDG